MQTLLKKHSSPHTSKVTRRSTAFIWVCVGLAACVCIQRNIDGQSSDAHSAAPVQHSAATELDELQTGTSLTREGKLEEAIPHLLAAQTAGADQYAAGVNLAICYVGTGRYKDAIANLDRLQSGGYSSALIHNLMAQAYLGDRQPKRAWDTFLAAVALTPNDEKLYAFMADACTDQSYFEVGLRAMDIGLNKLPDSARLHYERGLFLAQLTRLEEARPEWDRAAQLAPASYMATLALVQRDLYDGKISEATQRVLAMVTAGHRDYKTLSLLGTVLLHASAVPGDAEFARAEAVLEESARVNPEFSATQIALGRIYVLRERYREAVEHLEIGRRLEPRNPAVYSNLAHAYRRLGDSQKAHQMLEELGRLLDEQKTTAMVPIANSPQ